MRKSIPEAEREALSRLRKGKPLSLQTRARMSLRHLNCPPHKWDEAYDRKMAILQAEEDLRRFLLL